MEVLESCLAFDYLAVDTEGWAPDILGISIAPPFSDGMYFPLRSMEDVNIDEETKEVLYDVLTRVPYRVMHHAGHDINSIPEIADLPFICTMIMGHMVDENVMSKGLDYMHKHYCKKDGKQRPELMQSIIDSMGWDWVPIELMNLYASVDAEITMELFLTLKPLYEAQFGDIWTPSNS